MLEITFRNRTKTFAPDDMRTSTIQELFFEHMKKLTVKANGAEIDSFDHQFSDRWLPRKALHSELRLNKVII
jgi:hypothetical protein